MRIVNSTKCVLFALVVSALSACAISASRMTNVSVGMAREDVIRTLGKPDGTGVNGDKEYLNYRLMENGWTDWEPTPYSVVLQNGKVVTFGRESQVK